MVYILNQKQQRAMNLVLLECADLVERMTDSPVRDDLLRMVYCDRFVPILKRAAYRIGKKYLDLFTGICFGYSSTLEGAKTLCSNGWCATMTKDTIEFFFPEAKIAVGYRVASRAYYDGSETFTEPRCKGYRCLTGEMIPKWITAICKAVSNRGTGLGAEPVFKGSVNIYERCIPEDAFAMLAATDKHYRDKDFIARG